MINDYTTITTANEALKTVGGDMRAAMFRKVTPGQQARRERRRLERAAAKARKRGGCW